MSTTDSVAGKSKSKGKKSGTPPPPREGVGKGKGKEQPPSEVDSESKPHSDDAVHAPEAPKVPKLRRLRSVDLIAEWRSLPAAPLDISALRFTETKAILHLAGGSGGVTLLHLPEGVIGIKVMMMNAVAEFFAEQLAGFVGVRVAKLGVVSYGMEVFFQIKQAIKIAAAPIEEHRDISRRGMGRTEFLGLLEFVAGCSVQGLQANNLLKNMSEIAFRDFWCKVGVLVALDVLLNNVDRVPLLWDNEGNTGNVMLVLDENSNDAFSSIVGIDQAVTALVDTFVPGRRRYLDRVSKLAFAVFSGSWELDSLSPARVAANEAADKAATEKAAAEKAAAEIQAAEMEALQKEAEEKAAASLCKALAGEDLVALEAAINEAWGLWLDTQAAEDELASRMEAAEQAAAERAAIVAKDAANTHLTSALAGEDLSALRIAIREASTLNIDTQAAEQELASRLQAAELKASAEKDAARRAAADAETADIGTPYSLYTVLGKEATTDVQSSIKGKGKKKCPPPPVKAPEQGKGKATGSKGKAKGGFVPPKISRLRSKGVGKKGKSKSESKVGKTVVKDPPQARSPPPAPRWSPLMGLKRVQEAFEVNCAVEVHAEAFMEGLRNGLALIADRWEDGSMVTSLDVIVENSKRTFDRSSVNVGLSEVEIMCDFVKHVAAVVVESRAASASFQPNPL